MQRSVSVKRDLRISLGESKTKTFKTERYDGGHNGFGYVDERAHRDFYHWHNINAQTNITV